MTPVVITAVVGPPGAGKTTWIRQQLARQGELQPQICRGWWEEQCFILHGIGSTAEPIEIILQYGGETVKLLWDSVSRHTVEWLRSLDFGFHDLDCLLIDDITVGVDGTSKGF